MQILVIAQDLRISGTSEGVVSRSFLFKLKETYPKSHIKVVYLKSHQNADQLEYLPVDSIEEYFISHSIPQTVIWINKIYWRSLHKNLKEAYVIAKYRAIIKKIDIEKFDHIFIRSSGQGYENILALKGLPILKKSIINFHDPYPVLWDTGTQWNISKIELNKLRNMWAIVKGAGVCISPANLLSQDMEHLYGSNKKFYTLPHQYAKEAFPPPNLTQEIRKRKKEICISYHGAVQLGRNIDILLDAYLELIKEDPALGKTSEVVLRIRGNHTKRLKEKYKHPNIEILDTLDFCSSALEQKKFTDIVIILENCSPHSNILVGKAPFLASLRKPVLSLSPLRSEMRKVIQTDRYIANCNDLNDVKSKLKNLILTSLQDKESVYPFGDYFNDSHFKESLNSILDIS